MVHFEPGCVNTAVDAVDQHDCGERNENQQKRVFEQIHVRLVTSLGLLSGDLM